MKRMLSAVLIFGTLTVGQVRAQEGPELAKKVRVVFEKSCYPCHGQNASKSGGFDWVLDFDKLRQATARATNPERKKPAMVIPGDADRSPLFLRLGVDKDMPPDDFEGPRPTNEEIELVKKWIVANAPAPTADVAPARPFVTTSAMLSAIQADLLATPREDRPFRRYFTLTHLHNDPRVLDKDFRLYRAALSKLLNSLSWKRDIVLPSPVDTHQTIFAIDLRHLDWEKHGLWNEVLKRYPYGLKHDRFPDETGLSDKALDVYEMTGTPIPFIRADWFIAAAGRPPLYHTLMFDNVLPKLRERTADRKNPQNPRHMTALDLEEFLGVDIERNFRLNQLQRAGFIKSGVSGQNRLLERHDALHGSYWKSYDFKQDSRRNNLFQFPLGPVFEKNPFAKMAFEHDGGEIIFNLPNGLQAYLLINGKDERIDEGPIEVVSDRSKTSGTNVIVNGLSCMSCHKRGMISEFKDEIRTGTGVGGEAVDKVKQLYVSSDEMNKLVEKDEARFMSALEQAVGSFLTVGEDKGKNIREFREPIGEIARWYVLEELDLPAIARELGVQDEKKLAILIDGNQRLLQYGLGILTKGGAIKRADWEKLEGTSLFQDVAYELRLGTPLR